MTHDKKNDGLRLVRIAKLGFGRLRIDQRGPN
jgi:hypothetical protein